MLEVLSQGSEVLTFVRMYLLVQFGLVCWVLCTNLESLFPWPFSTRLRRSNEEVSVGLPWALRYHFFLIAGLLVMSYLPFLTQLHGGIVGFLTHYSPVLDFLPNREALTSNFIDCVFGLLVYRSIDGINGAYNLTIGLVKPYSWFRVGSVHSVLLPIRMPGFLLYWLLGFGARSLATSSSRFDAFLNKWPQSPLRDNFAARENEFISDDASRIPDTLTFIVLAVFLGFLYDPTFSGWVAVLWGAGAFINFLMIIHALWRLAPEEPGWIKKVLLGDFGSVSLTNKIDPMDLNLYED